MNKKIFLLSALLPTALATGWYFYNPETPAAGPASPQSEARPPAATVVVAAPAIPVDEIVEIGKLKRSAERVAALAPLLAGFTTKQYTAVLAAIAEAYGKDRRLFNEVFDGWCRQDPEAAVKWATDSFPQGREGRLLKEKAGQAWAAIDFDKALKWMLTLPGADRKWSLAEQTLAKLAESDPGRALTYISEAHVPRLARYVKPRIFEAWVALDPKAAFDNMAADVSETPEFIKGVQAWGARDAQSAVAWVVTNGKNSERGVPYALVPKMIAEASANNRKAVADLLYASDEYKGADSSTVGGLQTVLLLWATQSPAEVSGWLDTMKSPGERNEIAEQLLANEMYLGDDENPRSEWRLPFANALTDPERRKTMLADVVSEWAYNDPDGALKWAATQADPMVADAALISAVGHVAKLDPQKAIHMIEDIASAEQKHKAVGELIFGWAETDPQAATEWAWSASGGNLQKDGAVVYSLQAWASKDAPSAIAWANQEKTGPEIVQGATESILKNYGVEEAATVLAAIADRAQREIALIENARRWLRTDRKGALKWLEQSELNAGQRNALLHR